MIMSSPWPGEAPAAPVPEVMTEAAATDDALDIDKAEGEGRTNNEESFGYAERFME